MAETADVLSGFVADLRRELVANPGTRGREGARDLLAQSLRNPDFVGALLAAKNLERDVVYEDPELGFCVCVHVYGDAKTSDPHDHGPTWAIYGQAEGETEMSDWRVTEAGKKGEAVQVERASTYRLRPGDAHLYDVGDIHSPHRDAPTKLIRIEGQNTEQLARTPIVIAASGD